MNICVINGSPKGKYSVTLQSILYLEKKYKIHSFDILNIGQKIKYYEKHMDEVLASLTKADLILFAYPVYTFLAPSQLHKFIYLLKHENIDLTNKYVSQITTSKHFYDMSAHEYIKQNSLDLKMKYIVGLSGDMDDLTTQKGQNELIKFFDFLQYSVENDIFEETKIPEVDSFVYTRQHNVKYEKDDKFKVVYLTDSTDNIPLIEDFDSLFPYQSKVINISNFPFSGGCLGCFSCAASGNCIYKDNFEIFLRNDIQNSDAIIYAFKVQDHSMGHVFKLYDDRQFCNGHRMVNIGLPIAYLVNGNLNNENNLKTVIEARSEVGHNYLAGISEEGKNMISISKKLCYALENKYYLPQNFYGVGGRKIFRDLVYVMRGLMKADHKFYKENGIYDDLPHKAKKRMLFMLLIGSLSNNEKIKAKMGNKMAESIIKPYQKIIDNI